MASISGHVKVLALLLDRNADPNLSDNSGITAAHCACQFGHLKCLQLLRERNADLNARDAFGETPLDDARTRKQPECVDLLLAYGCIGKNKEDLDALSMSKAEKVFLHYCCTHHSRAYSISSYFVVLLSCFFLSSSLIIHHITALPRYGTPAPK